MMQDNDTTINIEREREGGERGEGRGERREERKQTPMMMMTQQSKIKRDNY
jgi:hypothetical protein